MKKRLFTMLAVVALTLSMTVTAFASTPTNLSITEGMLQPLIDGVTANIGVILPVGLGLFAIFLGISLIPKLIKKFTSS